MPSATSAPSIRIRRRSASAQPRSIVDDHRVCPRRVVQHRHGVLQQRRPRFGVEPGERLIKQQHIGRNGDRPRQVNAPALASRQLACQAARRDARPRTGAAPRARARRSPRGTPHQASASSRSRSRCAARAPATAGRSRRGHALIRPAAGTPRRARQQCALPAPLGPSSATTSPRAKLELDIPHDLALAAPHA